MGGVPGEAEESNGSSDRVAIMQLYRRKALAC